MSCDGNRRLFDITLVVREGKDGCDFLLFRVLVRLDITEQRQLPIKRCECRFEFLELSVKRSSRRWQLVDRLNINIDHHTESRFQQRQILPGNRRDFLADCLDLIFEYSNSSSKFVS